MFSSDRYKSVHVPDRPSVPTKSLINEAGFDVNSKTIVDKNVAGIFEIPIEAYKAAPSSSANKPSNDVVTASTVRLSADIQLVFLPCNVGRPKTDVPEKPSFLCPTHFYVRKSIYLSDLKYRVNVVLESWEERGLVFRFNSVSTAWNCSFLSGTTHGSFRVSAYCEVSKSGDDQRYILELQSLTGEGGFVGSIFRDLHDKTGSDEPNPYINYGSSAGSYEDEFDFDEGEDGYGDDVTDEEDDAESVAFKQAHEQYRMKARDRILENAYSYLMSPLRDTQLLGTDTVYGMAKDALYKQHLSRHTAALARIIVGTGSFLSKHTYTLPDELQAKRPRFSAPTAGATASATTSVATSESTAAAATTVFSLDWTAAIAISTMAVLCCEEEAPGNLAALKALPNRDDLIGFLSRYSDETFARTALESASPTTVSAHSYDFNPVALQALRVRDKCLAILKVLQ